MGHLTLRLLGSFEALLDGRRLTDFGYDKVRALLAYVAVERTQAHSRQALAGLLWPEQDEEHARQSLRQALNSLRTVLGDRRSHTPFLLVNRDTIRFNAASAHDIDVAAFDSWREADCRPHAVRTRAVCRQRHLQAASHYRGPFLANFSLPDVPEFENWLQLKREWLERQALELFQRLAACHEQTGEVDKALHYAHAQLGVDPWNEEAHQQVMRLLAQSGQRNAAIAHYQRCRQLLAEDLGVEPDRRTRALYEQMCAGLVERTVGPPVELLRRHEPSEPRFCSGAPHGHAGERRLLTVLCCEPRDALAEDPEDLYEQLREYYRVGAALLRRYGGYVVERENGVLTAYFGHPHLCEEAAREALLAACALREQLADTHRPRIRLHTGIVLVPPELRGACGVQAEVVGTTPMLARALHGLMPQTDLLISDSTHELVADVVHWRSLGHHAPPDHSQPLGVYEVLRPLDAVETLQRRSAGSVSDLVGREAELQTLNHWWQRAQGGNGQAVLLSGEPGIGKTALAAALWQWIGDTGEPLIATCSPHMSSRPFQCLSALLRQALDSVTGSEPMTGPERLRHGLQQLGLPAAYHALAPLFHGAGGAAEGLLGGETRPIVRRQLLRLFKRLARSPRLIVIEDLHWADADTLDLLGEVITEITSLPLLLVLSARTSWAPPWPADALEPMQLGPLEASPTEALLRRHGAADLNVDDLVQRCEGVPLFAVALARSAAADGAQPEGPAGGLPLVLSEVLGTALDRLGPAKAVVQLASALGREFPEWLLTQVLGRSANLGFDPAGLAEVLEKLVTLGIFETRSQGGEPGYRFRRGLLRDAAFASQSRAQQRLLTQWLAEAQAPAQALAT